MSLLKGMFRSKAWTDLAAHQECQIKIQNVCVTYPCVSCHSNQQRHGKGGSNKAHDVFVAWGCSACHDAIDQDNAKVGLTRQEKMDYWQWGFERTLVQLCLQGLIKVA